MCWIGWVIWGAVVMIGKVCRRGGGSLVAMKTNGVDGEGGVEFREFAQGGKARGNPGLVGTMVREWVGQCLIVGVVMVVLMIKIALAVVSTGIEVGVVVAIWSIDMIIIIIQGGE